jgi:TPP-dependent pyruvate/acetoin dehydrogenase alpha subunit
MEQKASSARVSVSAMDGPGSLSPQQLVEIYRLMVLSRRMDDREILLKRQQKIFFQISGAGHEALGLGAAWPCAPVTTGSSPTIAIARSAWRWASRPPT